MKIFYSQIKELIPGLKANVNSVAEALTITGSLVEKIESRAFKGKDDFLLTLEIRQNRPDCLGVIGLSREVAAYFGLKVVLPKVVTPVVKNKLKITVSAKNDVKRVTVVRIDNVKNGDSPAWLKEFLDSYGINSVSLLVDLSNYAMIYTGFPNHIFDTHKVSGELIWERAQKNLQLETLDGTMLELKQNNHLVISDKLTPLVLASAVGGKRSAISKNTVSVLAEVAVYNGAKLLQDARSLNVTTEAGTRLQKDLATEPAKYALMFLVHLLQTYAGGTVASGIFDYYPKQKSQKVLELPANLPSLYSGIEISETQIYNKLKSLGFNVKSKGKKFKITAPIYRTDILDTIDCIEEVIRMVGFHKIPSNTPPILSYTPNITPKRITFVNSAKLFLQANGFDEILSLPLTTTDINSKTNYQDWKEITAENSINEALPALRQNLIAGLLNQQKTYLLKNINHIAIFEAGKVFGKLEKKYEEVEMLAGLLQKTNNSLENLGMYVKKLLITFGLKDVSFKKRVENVPAFANPHSCFNILINNQEVGIIFKSKPQKLTGNSTILNTSVFELNIDSLIKNFQNKTSHAATELEGKLVVLDVNITSTRELIEQQLTELKYKIGNKLWGIEVIGEWPSQDKINYTVRVSYTKVTEAEAKIIHTKIFA